VETFVEIVVGTAVGGGYGVVHLDVELPEFLDVSARMITIMNAVVALGKPYMVECLVLFSADSTCSCRLSNAIYLRWKSEVIETVGGAISQVFLQRTRVFPRPGLMESGLQNTKKLKSRYSEYNNGV
jgi:hypothetical protein